jgi:hypothetical protein
LVQPAQRPTSSGLRPHPDLVLPSVLAAFLTAGAVACSDVRTDPAESGRVHPLDAESSNDEPDAASPFDDASHPPDEPGGSDASDPLDVPPSSDPTDGPPSGPDDPSEDAASSDADTPDVSVGMRRVDISPTPLFNDSVARCTATLEGGSAPVVYVWTRAATGEILGDGPLLALQTLELAPEDVLTCRADALLEAGERLRGEANASIANRSPRILSFTLHPTPARVGDTVTCDVDAIDPDGDRLTTTYRWSHGGDGRTWVVTPATSVPADTIVCRGLVSDGRGGADEGQAGVLVENSPPIVHSARVLPSAPEVGAWVRCEGEAFDPDERGVVVTAEWLDGASGDAYQIQRSDRPGTTIGCMVLAEDPDGGSTRVAAVPATVQNSPPSLLRVEVTPSEARVGDSIHCTHEAEDPNGDELVVVVAWDNGLEGPVQVLEPASSDPGDRRTCTVRVTDPHGASATRSSDGHVAVGNTPPTPLAVEVRPAEAQAGQPLTCHVVVPSTDPDGGHVTYTHVWERDGAWHTTLRDAGTRSEIPGDQVTPLSTWTCTVTASDGFEEDDVTSFAAARVGPARDGAEGWTDLARLVVWRDASGQMLPDGADGAPIELGLGPGPRPGETAENTPPRTQSRLLYVASDGDDRAAASVYGRGYYLPGDPEIGPDPTEPLGPIVAYATPSAAEARLRRPNLLSSEGTDDRYRSAWADRRDTLGHGWNGYPDWLLLRRGDRFDALDWESRPGHHGPPWRGRSAAEPMVITAWGPPWQARPILGRTLRVPGWSKHLVIASLDLADGLAWGSVGGGAFRSELWGENVWIEDVYAGRITPGRSFGATNAGYWDGVTVRRSVIVDSFDPTGHTQGIFIGNHVSLSAASDPTAAGGFVRPVDRWTFEECVFDRNGYKEDPADPTRWTASVVSTLGVGPHPPGEGIQPWRTYFDRNVYVGTGDGVNHAVTVMRGNLLSRGGGGGSVQQRQGGVSERNVFLWNEDAGYVSSGAGGWVLDNVILHDDHLLPPGGWGVGIGSWISDGEQVRGYRIEGNIVAHMHRALNTNEGASLHAQGGSGLGTLVIRENVVYRPSGGRGIRIADDAWLQAEVAGNEIAVGLDRGGRGGGEAIGGVTSNQEGRAYQIGEADVGGNLYWAPSSTAFGGSSFLAWRAIRESLDESSVWVEDFAEFCQLAGWVDPERDIVSYVQSVDSTFVPQDDVTVDAGVPAHRRRANAPLVWQVLRDNPAWPRAMSEAQARQTARRYHAFVHFIARARANRRGDWDPHYTALALHAYIREGFGKDARGGPYTSEYPAALR